MKPRRKCENCGASVDPDLVKSRKRANKTILCRACVTQEQTEEPY